MKAKIWVDSKKKYESYELPDGATMYENDMDKVVSCACCGKKVLMILIFHYCRINLF